MAISQKEGIVFVVNFVPISLAVGAMFNARISPDTNYDLDETTASTGFSLIGTGFSGLSGAKSKSSKIFFQQKRASRFHISFKIANNHNGLILNRTLLQFDTLIRTVANVPCQWFGLGTFMLLGFVDSSSPEIEQYEGFNAYSYSFTERTFSVVSSFFAPSVGRSNFLVK